MGLTHYALEVLGYRRRREDESVSAAFSSVHAYEVQGVSPSPGLLIEANGTIGGIDYRLAFSESLNAAALRVASDNFADDEPAWAKEHRCSPPYLLIHIGPTPTHTMTGDFLKDESFGLQTYDAFIPARRELREMEGKVVPTLLSALACTFGTLRNPVRFRELERAVVGKTADGKTVFDFGLEFRAELRVGQVVPAPDLQDLMRRATELATRINPKIAHFYYLALKEDDPLKRFLHLFLTIERQTHAVFNTTDHRSHMDRLVRAPERLHATGASFFGKQHERWTSLQDRFIWCALTIWTHLTDDDVDSFVKVKKVRHQLAHGEIVAPSAEAVMLVERVAAKLQLALHGADD
jgi:hypothetical protein